jgi:hypothetical protein
LSTWIESANILSDEQCGFRKDRSTVDQIFILTECIINRRPRPTYVAFIDIQKAYDRVWRNGLWKKLLKAGIKGKLWRILRNIYAKVESSVLLGNSHTDWFSIFVGLRQGCLLSPILFDLFLDDLVQEIQNLGKGVKCGNKRVSILLFADDIALLAETKEDLELMLKTLYEYSLKWRFKFNLDKCAVIVFDNKPHNPFVYGNCDKKCSCGYHWFFGSGLIRQVLLYKYLGVELDNCLTFKDFRIRILQKARSNMSRVWMMGLKSGYLTVKGGINLWEALVRSILEFSAEIWGFDAWKEGEAVQYDMCRRILRCSSKTSKDVLVGELGFWSLKARRDLKKLLFWYKVLLLPNTRIIKQALAMSCASQKAKAWGPRIKIFLVKYNLVHLWSNNMLLYNLDGKGNLEAKTDKDHRRFWKSYITKIIFQHEQSTWYERLWTKDKLRSYRYFKSHLRFENYLSTSTYFRG